jgi:hypothetical protein
MKIMDLRGLWREVKGLESLGVSNAHTPPRLRPHGAYSRSANKSHTCTSSQFLNDASLHMAGETAVQPGVAVVTLRCDPACDSVHKLPIRGREAAGGDQIAIVNGERIYGSVRT